MACLLTKIQLKKNERKGFPWNTGRGHSKVWDIVTSPLENFFQVSQDLNLRISPSSFTFVVLTLHTQTVAFKDHPPNPTHTSEVGNKKRLPF